MGEKKSWANAFTLVGLSYQQPIARINRVIFNDPVTVVFWTDGSKTVVKAANEPFDKEKGLAMAIAKKALGNKGNYYNQIRKWVEQA